VHPGCGSRGAAASLVAIAALAGLLGGCDQARDTAAGTLSEETAGDDGAGSEGEEGDELDCSGRVDFGDFSYLEENVVEGFEADFVRLINLTSCGAAVELEGSSLEGEVLGVIPPLAPGEVQACPTLASHLGSTVQAFEVSDAGRGLASKAVSWGMDGRFKDVYVASTSCAATDTSEALHVVVFDPELDVVSPEGQVGTNWFMNALPGTKVSVAMVLPDGSLQSLVDALPPGRAAYASRQVAMRVSTWVVDANGDDAPDSAFEIDDSSPSSFVLAPAPQGAVQMHYFIQDPLAPGRVKAVRAKAVPLP
jgi:hypothetical protein